MIIACSNYRLNNNCNSYGKRKPGVCDQTYFSFLSPAPLPNAHAHEEKYGWLARLGPWLIAWAIMYNNIWPAGHGCNYYACPPMGWASQRATRTASTSSYLSQASCVILSGFRAALDLDTYYIPLVTSFVHAERAKPGRGKPVLIMRIIWLFRLFPRHISRTQSFQPNHHIFFCLCSTEAVGIAYKPPRSLRC